MAAVLLVNFQMGEGKIDVLSYLHSQVVGTGLRNIIQFGTSLPGYQELAQTDQITLLKSALLEILVRNLDKQPALHLSIFFCFFIFPSFLDPTLRLRVVRKRC